MKSLAEDISWWKENGGKIVVFENGDVEAIGGYKYDPGTSITETNWRGKIIVKKGPEQHRFYFMTVDRIQTDYIRYVSLDSWQVPIYINKFKEARARYVNIQIGLRLFKNNYIDAII